MTDLTELKTSGEAPVWMTEEGYQTLSGTFLMPNETPRTAWRRVVKVAAEYMPEEVKDFEETFFSYLWKGWIGLASPVFSNMGTDRGLPVSCYATTVGDSVDSIFDHVHETALLSKNGGGVAVDLSSIRPAGSTFNKNGTSNGVVPWMSVFDRTSQVVSQGATRRGAFAFYIDIEHKDLPSVLHAKHLDGTYVGETRYTIDSNVAVTISDAFMNAMLAGDKNKFELFAQVLRTRMQTGSPYLFFSDNVNNNNPEIYNKLGLKVRTSNICTEIVEYTDEATSFTCVLSSLNLAHYFDWRNTNLIQYAIFFLDAVCSEFIEKGKHTPGLDRAVRGAELGRPLGLGYMGLHTLLQKYNLTLDSPEARKLNLDISKLVHQEANIASQKLAEWSGPCRFGEMANMKVRNTHLIAVAPTVTNSTIMGGVSPSIEPIVANVFGALGAKGNFVRKNPNLVMVLQSLGLNTPAIWQKINDNYGSVAEIDAIPDQVKAIYKTAREVDQFLLLDMAVDRQPYIDQAQSLNLFVNQDVDAKTLLKLHLYAWQKKLKTLYYLLSSKIR